MSARLRSAARRSLAAALLSALVLSAAACGSPKAGQPRGAASGGGVENMDDMNMGSIPTAPALAEAAPLSTGLAGEVDGYIYEPSAETVAAGAASSFSFHITGPDDHALTRYQPYESRLILFYLIRSDLTGYRQFDPTMREDGTWVVGLPPLAPGSYRTYVAFAAPDSSAGTPLRYELSSALTVPGKSAGAALPAASQSTTTDGYKLTLSGALKANKTLQLDISVTSGGKPVVYFNRYLDGYAHVTGFRVGDAAFAHTLSTGRAGGPNGSGAITEQVLFPESGMWRLFVEFETAGNLHTAAFTVNVS